MPWCRDMKKNLIFCYMSSITTEKKNLSPKLHTQLESSYIVYKYIKVCNERFVLDTRPY